MTDSDLTERARIMLAGIMRHISYVDSAGAVHRPFKPAEIGPKSLAIAVAALQSEREAAEERLEIEAGEAYERGVQSGRKLREAAAAEARQIIRDLVENFGAGGPKANKAFAVATRYLLASPAPQEETQ